MNKKLEFNEKELLSARLNFATKSIVGTAVTGKVGNVLKAVLEEESLNSYFESLGCIGYHPELEELTASINIKRPTGYGGNLCANGTSEYVRFYLDFGQGNGWEDMGVSAVNVHDIPTEKDCDGDLEKPITYVIRHKIDPENWPCSRPNIPKVRAILSWQNMPVPNDPDMTSGYYYWGDVKEDYIQIKTEKKFLINPNLNVGVLLEKMVANPSLSLSNLESLGGKYANLVGEAKNKMASVEKAEFGELVEKYTTGEDKVEVERFTSKLLNEVKSSADYSVIANTSELFKLNNLSLAEALEKLNEQKCNTNYEELFCAGLDYHNEALVGTLKIKRSFGYNGNLCQNGSKEFVSFWVQEEGKCQWEHIGTSSVNVYDIPMPANADGISYSVVIPHNFKKYRKECKEPVVLKLRAILSWNSDPGKDLTCSNYGNVVESYIQISPKTVWDGVSPKLITVGGLATDFIDNTTGLSMPGAKFEFNQVPVAYSGSPFGGIIVIQGISAPNAGSKYRIKITNLATNASYYLSNNLTLTGYNPGTGQVTHPVVVPDANHYYTYQPYYNNISSILARFSPGTNDRLKITIEELNGGTDEQIIQMDSTTPVLTLDINDNGDCSHYSKGDIIHGTYSVSDNYVAYWKLWTNICNCLPGTSLQLASGTTSQSGAFTVDTNVTKNCGNIHLRIYQKRIYNSVRDRLHNDRDKIVCIDQ